MNDPITPNNWRVFFAENSPARQSFRIARDIAGFVLLLIFLVWLTVNGARQLGYHWQWYRVPQYFFVHTGDEWIVGPLVQGLMVTCKITVVSLVLAVAFGLTGALFMLSNSIVAGFVARVYVEIVRNTPLLIQIFLLYFVISPVLGIGRFVSAVLALSLFEGAYAAEIFRAGITSVDEGQWEAAYSLGLSRNQTYLTVILPQAVRRVLPPLTSQGVSLIKDSALVSTIAIYDLTMQGQAIVAETFLTFEIWFTVAAVYLVITTILSTLANLLETRMGAGSR